MHCVLCRVALTCEAVSIICSSVRFSARKSVDSCISACMYFYSFEGFIEFLYAYLSISGTVLRTVHGSVSLFQPWVKIPGSKCLGYSSLDWYCTQFTTLLAILSNNRNPRTNKSQYEYCYFLVNKYNKKV